MAIAIFVSVLCCLVLQVSCADRELVQLIPTGQFSNQETPGLHSLRAIELAPDEVEILKRTRPASLVTLRKPQQQRTKRISRQDGPGLTTESSWNPMNSFRRFFEYFGLGGSESNSETENLHQVIIVDNGQEVQQVPYIIPAGQHNLISPHVVGQDNLVISHAFSQDESANGQQVHQLPYIIQAGQHNLISPHVVGQDNLVISHAFTSDESGDAVDPVILRAIQNAQLAQSLFQAPLPVAEPNLEALAQLKLAHQFQLKQQVTKPSSYSKVFKTPLYDHFPPRHHEKQIVSNTIEDSGPVYSPRDQFSVIPEDHSASNAVFASKLRTHLNKRDAGQRQTQSPSNFVTPKPLDVGSNADLIIGSMLSFGGSSALLLKDQRAKARQKPVRSVSRGKNVAINFPSEVPDFDVFNITRANGEGKCKLENGQAFHAGKCSLLLRQGTCLVDHWLVLRPEGTPVCAHRPCPWGTLKYNNECVDPADQSVCGVGQMLHVHFTGESECDCDPKHIYDPTTEKCFAEHERGYCKEGFYLELEDDNTVNCVPNPCHQEGFIQIDDRCYRKEYDGVCPTSQIMFIPENGSAECMETVPKSIFGVGIQTACPAGSRRSYLRRCRSIFRIPAQRTFPKQRGVCPRDFAGGSKHSCRRTISLFG